MVDVFIGMDDTDNKESRGTGHLAVRVIWLVLSPKNWQKAMLCMEF